MSTLCIVEDAQGSAELMTEVASRRAESSTQMFASSLDARDRRLSDEEDDSAEEPIGPVRGLIEKVRRLKRSRVA